MSLLIILVIHFKVNNQGLLLSHQLYCHCSWKVKLRLSRSDSLRRRQMTGMASLITVKSSVCLTVCSDRQQRNIKGPCYRLSLFCKIEEWILNRGVNRIDIFRVLMHICTVFSLTFHICTPHPSLPKVPNICWRGFPKSMSRKFININVYLIFYNYFEYFYHFKYRNAIVTLFYLYV